MLSKLRDYSSYFLWFMVVIFVVFMTGLGIVKGCNPTPMESGKLAEINGQAITRSAYDQAVSRATQNRQAESPEELNDQQVAQIRDQTWNQLVGALLVEQEADRRGITVTDQELANFLRQYPPEELRQIPEFQTDGQFDYNKYLAAMSNTEPGATQFWRSVESFWRPQLRQSKLQQQIISTVRVSDAELKDSYRRAHDAIRMEFVLVDAAPYLRDAGTPTDQQLSELYEQEKYRYQRFERVQLELAIWNRNPSQGDKEWAKTQAEDIHKQLLEGANFEELAEIHTMDPSGATSGGDLGWFGQGAMVAAFEEAAFALKPGEISPVVETQFGFHVIKLEERRKSEADKTKEEVRARHILIKPTVSQATTDSILAQANDFAFAVRAGDTAFTQSSVSAAGGVWFRPTPVQRAENVAMVGPIPDVKAWAFAADPGELCDPIDDGGRFIVARMVEKRPAGPAPLDEVKSLVQQRWNTIRSRELAKPRADSLYALAKNGAVMKDLAEPGVATLTTTGLVTRLNSIAPVGKSPVFMGAAFALTEEAPWSDVVPVENGWVFIHLLEAQPSDLSALATSRDSIAGEILRTKQNNAFNVWVSDLFEAAEIKDYRGAYYGSM